MTSPGDRTEPPKPVVEPSAESADRTTGALQQRIRQQEILAELGVVALQGRPFPELLNETVRLTAEGMQAEFCKVLEYLPADNRLLVRAGVGWHEDIVGNATVGADLESPSGFALQTGKPVISNHLENEQRFRTPGLLVEHGIRRAMNVILQGDGSPYGVLEVDSRSEGEFSENDITFLQGAANILGMAIERQRYERQLKTALDRHQILLKEITHRVKNSLQVVISMLHLQASASNDATLGAQLAEASSRVSAIGRAYERLAYDENVETIALDAYLRDVCTDAIRANSHCQLEFTADPRIHVDADRAIPIALIVNELITNAAKHTFPEGPSPGGIAVRLTERTDASILLTVSDKGPGLPADFDIAKSKGSGMRVVIALTQQLGGTITYHSGVSGTEFILSIPISVRAGSSSSEPDVT
jgi:two-component sensor histidine kinase